MAEMFLTPIIHSLIDLLKDEVGSIKGIRKKVESLKRELDIIQALLKDADAKANREDLISDAMKVWMKQLREEADHINDVIDEYRWHVVQGTTEKCGLNGFLLKIGGPIKALKSRYTISSQIEDIIQSLRQIKDVGQGFGLSRSLQGSGDKTWWREEHGDRFGAHFVEEDEEYVDIPLFQGQLKSFLLEGESARMIISLVGQGGIGKTTLAKKVYNEVKHKFEYHAWITVSQSYDMKILLKDMMGQIGLKSECIIFDDVWDTNFWEKMKYALPGNDNGSRVIITTRNEVVAPCDFVQKLETWSHDMAYELFSKKILGRDFKCLCPEELEKLSHKIIQKCQGLPLAIRAIAGLLSRKNVQSEWQKVLDNIDFEFKTNSQLTRIFQILSLSYHDLPYHLKPCFLYFGIFPEDYLIEKNKLCRLWISEGFVQARESKTAEEEAEGYINELVERSLVCFEILHGTVKVYSTATITNKIQQFTGVRSILLLNINGIELIDKSFWIALFKSSKLLKVLDFENAPLDYLPKEVGNLFQLRYLNLKDTNIKVLPESICNLHDLQYLNLENTQVDKLPKSIGKLRNLRFLNILYAFVWELPLEINKLCNLRQVFASRKEDTQANLSAVKIQEGFSYLENLEILMHVEVHQDVIGFINELKNLSNLKMLGVSNLTKETSRAICDVSKRLNHLHTLILSVGDVDEILDLEPISSSPPPLLHTLYLSGQLNKFPHCLLDFNNLMMLALRLSKLTQNPLKYLKDLPNLICLLLIDNSYEGEQLHFEEGSFPKLNEIRFRNLPELKFMKIDKGALPLLKVLIIESCPLIEEVPSGIQYLTKLKKLCIWNMPKPFVDRVLSNEGTDYSKIQHIPIVDII
uniref:Uncharacterized protein n=1 Tax=Cannabis sativa TaxID=3483 RepID=A0A803QC48_CANSA